MRILIMIVLVTAGLGCSGQQQKNKFKDLDRPKSAVIR